MALPTPGNVTPMTPQIEQPANTLPGIDQAQANANPPPLPGAGAPPAASGLEAPPLPGMGGAPVQQAFHQPGTPPPVQGAEEIAPVTVIDHGQQAEYPTGAEMAQAQVVDATPAPPVDQAPPPLPQQTQTPPQQQMQPPPVQQPPQQQMQPPPQQQTPPQQQMQPPPVQQAPPPQQQMQPPPQQMQAPVQQIMPAQQPLQAPAVPPVGGNIIAAAGGISQALAAQGFEGLDMGFGSFPIVKLQDTTFSTSDGDTLGNTFCCVMHASRKKFLLKCEDSNDAEEFVYSYDKVHTTGNKLVEDVKKAWGEKGWVNPVWKEYADVTAQLVDLNNRELGGVVMLSIPYTSNSRLSGYITTLMVKGRQVNQVITQVYHGQKVTSGKFAFYPWAFKEYMLVSQMIGV